MSSFRFPWSGARRRLLHEPVWSWLPCFTMLLFWTMPSVAEQRETEAKAATVTDPAPPGPGDGSYGRFRGDVSYRLGVGAEWDPGIPSGRPLFMAELVGYQTVSVGAAYRESVARADPLTRSLSVNVTLTPLFLLRFSRARQTGYAFWDLFLDSLGVTGGVVLLQPEDRGFASAWGAEVGGTFAAPLMGRANGLWLRARVLAQGGRSALDEPPWGASGWLTLTWEGFFYTGLLKTRSP